jgi:preprotein translocase subunit SecG
MYTLLIILHLFVCIALIIVILLQSSKGGGLAGAFGGGGMGAVFGGRGTATFLIKVTTGLATAFLLIALIVGLLTRGPGKSESLVQQERESRGISSPAAVLPTVPEEGLPSGITPSLPTDETSSHESLSPAGEDTAK